MNKDQIERRVKAIEETHSAKAPVIVSSEDEITPETLHRASVVIVDDIQEEEDL